MSDGSLIRTLRGHEERIYSVFISPDNRILASASSDKTIKLWNMSDGSLIRTLRGHEERVYSIFISPDNRILASASWDKTIKLWNMLAILDPQNRDYSLLDTEKFENDVDDTIDNLKEVISKYYNSKIKETSNDNNLKEIGQQVNGVENQIKSEQESIVELKESINQINAEIQVLEYQQKQEKKNIKTAKKQEINSHMQNLTQLDQDIINSRDAIDDQEDIIKTNQRNIHKMQYQIKGIEEKMKNHQILVLKKRGEQKSLSNHLKLINTAFYKDLNNLKRNTKLVDLLLKIEKVIPLNQLDKYNFINLYQSWTKVKELKDCLSEDIKKDLDSLKKRYIQKKT